MRSIFRTIRMGQGQMANMSENPDAVHVRPVESKKDLDRFIKFPFRLYRDNPYWVPPLISERKEFFDPQRNPFYQHADVQLFLAERAGEVVGTIAGIINHTHNRVYEEKIAFWGIFETVEDYTVAEALFSAVSAWGKAAGMDILRGPMNMAFHHEFGLLIDAFDKRPVVATTYNPPYYAEFVEQFGFVKVKDHYAYYLDVSPHISGRSSIPEKLVRVAEHARRRAGVTIRKANLDDWENELSRAYDVFNLAWRDNWGAAPVSREEALHLIKSLKPFLDPDFVYIAEKDGKFVGVSLSLADINQPLYHIKGRLFPFGWIKFLYYRRRIDTVRVFIMGVVKEYRSAGLDAVFYLETAQAAFRKNLPNVEMSLILEDNEMMRRIIENFGGHIYKTYRMYDLPLNEDPVPHERHNPTPASESGEEPTSQE